MNCPCNEAPANTALYPIAFTSKSLVGLSSYTSEGESKDDPE